MEQLQLELGVKTTGIFKQKVEIVNHIPAHDLDYIRQIYKAGSEGRVFDYIGKGTYGCVRGYKNYAIKRFWDSDESKNQDVRALKALGHLPCIPTLYAVIDDEILIMQRINGVTIGDYSDNYPDNPANVDKHFIKQYENTLLSIIKEGYSPFDSHEYNVMIDLDRRIPVIVDVGFFEPHRINYQTEQDMRSNRAYDSGMDWAGGVLERYVKRIEAKNKKETHEVKENFAIVGEGIMIKDFHGLQKGRIVPHFAHHGVGKAHFGIDHVARAIPDVDIDFFKMPSSYNMHELEAQMDAIPRINFAPMSFMLNGDSPYKTRKPIEPVGILPDAKIKMIHHEAEKYIKAPSMYLHIRKNRNHFAKGLLDPKPHRLQA